MSLLSKLFGGGSASNPSAEPVTYKDFQITPDPMKDAATWRIAATIEMEIGGETKSHRLIRADTLESFDAAVEASVGKAKQMIDEQGDRIFN